MTEPAPEFELFATIDEAKAKNALGETFIVGGVPHVATTVEVDYGRRWVVKGVKKHDWPRRRQ